MVEKLFLISYANNFYKNTNSVVMVTILLENSHIHVLYNVIPKWLSIISNILSGIYNTGYVPPITYN